MTPSRTKCRVCGVLIETPAFDDPGPSLSSIRTVLPVRTQVYLCNQCGHAQSPDLPDLEEFYDTQYRISLDVDGHDQLYENREGERVFRTDYQAELVLALEVEKGAKVLDFGAGKATTLQKALAQRPDLVPHVFDVSEDYLDHWRDWIAAENQATYAMPERWTGHFDLITAHFVIEHVPDPVAVLADLRRCLAPDGRLFLSVPDAEANSGDLLVVDHLNHFSQDSLERALNLAGLSVQGMDREAFHGAFAVTATSGARNLPAAKGNAFKQSLDEWRSILDRIAAKELSAPVAIYGAGFYGSVIAARLNQQLSCFLDRNPFLQGQTHLGVPVLMPENCPADIRSVIAGLNPARARDILGSNIEWMPPGASLVFLDA
ncbi:methyltransferase domain-containing protein [Roseovarius sp. SCSIO 43702]|uniref:methyltransferase domain-containing protein n=1 Tax=Roseovarius sp. SCSIO 43702 TaxID=2823043 RepID=UPI001C737A55|nr:methyltransferase domain-containing protein [Roseovarius sp. SCSIO 43702]QYX55684.1 methyltransferase domain-containing protein [Roseovarius sp. SCSIO 43702]